MDNAPNGPEIHPPPPPSAPLPPDGSPPIYSGSVSLWLGFKTFFFAGLADLMGVAAMIYGIINRESALGTAMLICGLALLIASTLMAAYAALSIKNLRYTITRQLIEREQGIFFKRVDSLDLARIRDVELSQSLVDRMLNIGTLVILTSDRTDPEMRVEALPNPRPVYEKLRDAVIDVGRRRGVVSLSQ